MTRPGEMYVRMPHIKITAWRQGSVGDDHSDDMGVVDMKLPSGSPVNLLFEGPDNYLPQLQSLAGAQGICHTVHVTLLTVTPARELGINPHKHVKAILDQLDAQGIDIGHEQLERLRLMLRRFG